MAKKQVLTPEVEEILRPHYNQMMELSGKERRDYRRSQPPWAQKALAFMQGKYDPVVINEPANVSFFDRAFIKEFGTPEEGAAMLNKQDPDENNEYYVIDGEIYQRRLAGKDIYKARKMDLDFDVGQILNDFEDDPVSASKKYGYEFVRDMAELPVTIGQGILSSMGDVWARLMALRSLAKDLPKNPIRTGAKITAAGLAGSAAGNVLGELGKESVRDIINTMRDVPLGSEGVDTDKLRNAALWGLLNIPMTGTATKAQLREAIKMLPESMKYGVSDQEILKRAGVTGKIKDFFSSDLTELEKLAKREMFPTVKAGKFVTDAAIGGISGLGRQAIENLGRNVNPVLVARGKEAGVALREWANEMQDAFTKRVKGLQQGAYKNIVEKIAGANPVDITPAIKEIDDTVAQIKGKSPLFPWDEAKIKELEDFKDYFITGAKEYQYRPVYEHNVNMGNLPEFFVTRKSAAGGITQDRVQPGSKEYQDMLEEYTNQLVTGGSGLTPRKDMLDQQSIEFTMPGTGVVSVKGTKYFENNLASGGNPVAELRNLTKTKDQIDAEMALPGFKKNISSAAGPYQIDIDPGSSMYKDEARNFVDIQIYNGNQDALPSLYKMEKGSAGGLQKTYLDKSSQEYKTALAEYMDKLGKGQGVSDKSKPFQDLYDESKIEVEFDFNGSKYTVSEPYKFEQQILESDNDVLKGAIVNAKSAKRASDLPFDNMSGRTPDYERTLTDIEEIVVSPDFSKMPPDRAWELRKVLDDASKWAEKTGKISDIEGTARRLRSIINDQIIKAAKNSGIEGDFEKYAVSAALKEMGAEHGLIGKESQKAMFDRIRSGRMGPGTVEFPEDQFTKDFDFYDIAQKKEEAAKRLMANIGTSDEAIRARNLMQQSESVGDVVTTRPDTLISNIHSPSTQRAVREVDKQVSKSMLPSAYTPMEPPMTGNAKSLEEMLGTGQAIRTFTKDELGNWHGPQSSKVRNLATSLMAGGVLPAAAYAYSNEADLNSTLLPTLFLGGMVSSMPFQSKTFLPYLMGLRNVGLDMMSNPKLGYGSAVGREMLRNRNNNIGE